MKRSLLTALIALSALVLTVLAVFAGVGLYKAQTEPAFKDVTVELGTESLSIDAFLLDPAQKSNAAFVSDVRLLDLGKVGTTAVTLRRGQTVQTVNLTVQDTTAPQVEFLSTYTVPLDASPAPEDFIIAVTDASPVTVSFVTPPTEADDHSDQAVTVQVTDAYGNCATGTCTLRFDWIRSEVVLELGEELTRAHILLDPEKDGALISQEAINEVNLGGIGKYSLTVQSGSSSRTCSITVQDTLAPTLELKEVSIYPDRTCSLEDFILVAADASGEVELELLSDLPFGTEGDHVVKIKATDKNGLSVTAQTLLRIHKDITPPNIYGLFTMELKANSEAPDYMKNIFAKDQVDGYTAVTFDSSAVDLTRAGIYQVVYTSSDSTGNVTTQTRKVVVKPDYTDTKKLIEDIASGFDKTDPETLRDFIRNNIAYVPTWGGEDPVAFGFTNWYGNCYVHALCLQALLDYYGYETELIWVTNKTHYWLIINLDGTWYHIDGTPGNTHTRYSLMTNEQRLATLRGRYWDTSLWPQLNEETKK